MRSLNVSEKDITPSFIHQRNLPGVISTYVIDWEGKSLEGAYLIKNYLKEPKPSANEGVLLIPGIFDPVRGEYGEASILKLLSESGASCVYELHFRFEERCGLLNMEALMRDLRHIFSSDTKLKAIGLSGGSTFICTALFDLHEKGIQPSVSSALLLGPHMTDHPTIFMRSVRKVAYDQKMMAKVTRHAGHDNVPFNTAAAEEWLAQCQFTHAMRTFRVNNKRPGFPVYVEAHYFRFDTLAGPGRKRLHWYFDCPAPKKPMRGLHRGLFRVPESTQIICDFCKNNEA